MEVANGCVNEKDVVTYANALLARCNIEFTIEDSGECTSDLFLAFYHAILGDFPSGTLIDCNSKEAQVHNVKCVVETLSEDYLKVDLSHISPIDVVDGDLLSIYNLIEILDGLLDYLLEKIGMESDSGDEADIDSDQLSECARVMALQTIQQEMEKLELSTVDQSLSSTTELIALGKSLPVSDESKQNEPTFIRLEPHISLTPDTSPEELSDHTLHVTFGTSPKETTVIPVVSPVPSEPDSFKSLPNELNNVSARLSHLKSDSDLSEQKLAKDIVPHLRPESPQSTGIVVSDSGSSLNSERRRQALDVGLDDKHTSFLLKKKEHLRSGHESSSSESIDVTDGGAREQQRDQKDDAAEMTQKTEFKPAPKEKDWQSMLDNLQKTVEESKRIRQDYFSSIRSRSEVTASSEDFRSSLADDTATTEETLDDSLDARTKPRRKNVRFEDTISTKTAKELLEFRKLLQQEKALQQEKNKILSKSFRDHLDEVEESEDEKLDPLRQKVAQSEKKVKETLQRQKRSKGKLMKTRKTNLTDAAKWKSWLSPSKCKPPPRVVRATPKRASTAAPQVGSGIESINEYDLLPKLLEEFPQLELPPAVLNEMWHKQFRQIEHLTSASFDHRNKKRRSEMQLQEAHMKHELLTSIMQKEHEHTIHLRDVKERAAKQKEAQRILRDRRLQTARIRKYYKDYHLQMRGRMMKRRTKEEKIFKRLFEDGLAIQRARLRELRKYARDKREEQQKRQLDEIQSLENYYKDQFNILAETLASERNDLKVRDAAQMKLIRQMKKGLRQKMEKEIGDLQEMIARDDEDAYFREIEADRLRRQLQLATYHAKFKD